MFRSDGIGEPDENDDGRLKFVGRLRERNMREITNYWFDVLREITSY
jgi:hypothetical protein